MISLWVISELVRKGISKHQIQAGGAYLARQLETRHPYAHRDLAMAARQVGHASFSVVIDDVLEQIEFDPDLHASVWRPIPGISFDPNIQAGAPCIVGTRVPTKVVADLKGVGVHPEDIADDLNLEIWQVTAALEYENAA